MALVDSEPRHRNALPSIKHLDLDNIRTENMEHQRYSLSSAPLGSPNTIYSGPPPPYSCASSITGSQAPLSGYVSPPQSTRRSTRDEQESPTTQKSLPSIQEALGDKSMPYSATTMAAPVSTVHQQNASSHATPVTQSFPDAPRGPSNPFSQSNPHVPTAREPSFMSQPYPSTAPVSEPPRSHATFSSINTSEALAASTQKYSFPRSPRLATSSQSHFNTPYADGNLHSPQLPEGSRPLYTFTNGYSTQGPVGYAQPREHIGFGQTVNGNDQRMPPPRTESMQPYSQTVKREIDVFDAELALNEIGEASARTMDFSRVWSQRMHQSNRHAYFPEALPGIQEVEDMMRQSNRIMEGLNRIHETVIAQQHALSEQRIRASKGLAIDDEYGGLPDEYKMAGGFGGGDAKKRRGKAAPPGRCHSCNRAETPEWRRGPDGARTLCNACGLHYAKLTRKIGASKAAALGGSNLRPKNLDPRSPHM